jgi:hypothetical protein
MTSEASFVGSYMAQVVQCPKHGEHAHIIRSTIPNYQGVWCQICWLETLGPPLPSVDKKLPLNTEAAHGIKGKA